MNKQEQSEIYRIEKGLKSIFKLKTLHQNGIIYTNYNIFKTQIQPHLNNIKLLPRQNKYTEDLLEFLKILCELQFWKPEQKESEQIVVYIDFYMQLLFNYFATRNHLKEYFNNAKFESIIKEN